MSTSRTSWVRLEVVFVLGLIALLGLVAASLPLTGDQTVFAAGARELARGNVHYRDFGDVKQPGIYLFYLTVGSVFGYGKVAIHLVELGYQLVFAVVLILALRGTFRHRWIRPLVPLLILGTYYATVEPSQLGQVESLVGFPLFVCLWCSLRAVGGIKSDTSTRVKRTRTRVPWLIASGVAGGAVLVFKLALAPIVVSFWLITLWEIWRGVPTTRYRAIWWSLVALGLGVLIPIGATAAYLSSHGQLDAARSTYLEITSNAAGVASRPISRLTDGGYKTAIRWALPLTLGLVGVVAATRRGWDRLQVRLLAWIVLGVPVFLIQHWWISTFMMFLVPIGILAGYGLDTIVTAWRRERRLVHVALVAAALVLLIPAGIRFVDNSRDAAKQRFALSAVARAQRRLHPEHRVRPEIPHGHASTRQ
jgi:hypothetical protein